MGYNELDYMRKYAKSNKSDAQKTLEVMGSKFDKNGKLIKDLYSQDGKYFGTVSYDAYKAIEGGTLDSYKPKENEVSVIDKYKKLTGYGKTISDIVSQYKNDQYGKGNIDLANRPIYTNSDGKISTVDSITVGIDDKQVVLPTIIQDKYGNAKKLSDDEAVEHYYATGEHLGKFNTQEEADEYAQSLHIDQDLYYSFLQNSIYKPTKNGKEKHLIPGSHYYDVTGFDDIEHDYINGNEEAIGIVNVNETGSDTYKLILGTDSQWLQTITPEELSYYNYIYNVHGKEAGKEFIKSISGDLNLRSREGYEKTLREMAKKYPVASSVATVYTSPMKVISSVGVVNDYLYNGKIDQNSGYMKYSYGSNVIRNAVSEDIEKGWSGKVGSFLYQAGMSSADSLMNTAVTGGQQYLSLGLMGSGAFADTVLDAKDRGLSDEQALQLGVVAGGAEIFTENFSLSKLFSAKDIGKTAGENAVTSVRKYLLDNIKTNALEEMGADVINFAADTIIAKDKSQWQESINTYKKAGKSDSEAFGLAFRDTALQVAMSGLAGALSGGVMVGPSSIFVRSQINNIGKSNSENLVDIVYEGMNYDKNSEAYKNAVKLAKSKKDITSYDIGRQVLLNDIQQRTVNASNVSVGNVYVDTKTENLFKVVSRDDTSTTVERVTDEGTTTKKMSNNKIAKAIANGQVVSVATETTTNETQPVAEPTPVEETTVTETPVVTENAMTETPVATEQRNTFTEELDEIASTEMPTVSVGDTFIDSKTNNIIKVVGRDETTTTIEITTPDGKKEVITRPNHGADTLAVDEKYRKVETPNTAPAENVDVAENTTTTQTETPTTPKNINLTRVGNSYETYGDAAHIIAEELGLDTVKKVVNGVEVDAVSFPTEFYDGLVDELGGEYNFTISDTPTNTSAEAKSESKTSEPTQKEQKKKIIRAKKSDWASHDIYWYAPNSKIIIAYSTRSASDLIETMSEDNPKMTISELHDAINYDEEAKKVLQAYINSGFGDYVASEYFTDNGGKNVDTETPAADTKPVETETPETVSKAETVVEESPQSDVTLTDKCTLTETKRTDNGKDIWVVSLNDRISNDEFTELRKTIKQYGGNYSRFAKAPDGTSIPGFIFNSEPTAEAIQAFNDFFGKTEVQETKLDTDTQNTEEVLQNQSESDTIEEKDIPTVSDEDSPKDQSVNATDKSKGTKTIAKFVKARLESGKKISAAELVKVANVAFGGTMADNAYSIKDAYDAMELGVNQYIFSMKDVSADKMLELLELLPTQTKRTEEMVKFQQFSTPPSIAYLANYTANVNSNDIMLEPSAGIGGIAVFAKKDGAKVYVNELDNRRLDVLKNMPFDGFFNEDGEQIDNILGGEIEPTVIVMNPPFSSSAERNMHKTKIGAKHIEQALKILAPNGRLVAIVGNGMADGSPAFRTWWKDIKSQYNVKANIGINGKNYNKYGTNFDIQMLVIDKTGPTTQTVTGYVDTLQELQEKLGGIRDERPAIDYSTNKQRTPATTRQETVGESKSGSDGNGTVSDTNSVANERKPKDTSGTSGKSDIQDVQSTDADSGRTDNQASENTDVVVDEDKRVGNRQSDGLVGEENSVGVDNGDSGQSDIQTRRDEPRKRVKHKELTDSIFEQYQTQPLKVKNAQPHPAKVSESAAMSAIEPPTVNYKPNISQDLIDKGVVSAVQLEAISYAGQSHSQTLPNGTTRGFFLGDGTGIGKGRTIAGMMLDNYNQGRKKAVWVTLNSSLVNDAKRDTQALFGTSDLVTQFVGGNKADSVLSADEAILVVSYSALSKGFDNKGSNFEKIVEWLGKDFDGLIVFDEAHKMGNATATKGTRGMKKASQTGLAGIALQEALPKAKIVYSSATGATEVENLRYAERLGLWGDGTAFLTGDDFVSKIKAGGLAAMELIARDMKAMGVYLSRNISYEDVRYDKITHNLTAPQIKIYDELARSWQIVLQNINKALETTNQGKDGHARGRALGAFWSSQQRFFNQILTSMQVPSVISDIEKQLADGKSCVIQLVSTNEAAQNQEFERLKSEDLELDEFDLTPKQVLMSLIENSFPVQQFEEYRDDNGNVRSRPVFDSKGNPVINREAVRQRDELLTKLGSIKVPSSPIDMIINHFGTDMVAENTGRARRVVQKDGKTVEEKISSKKDADVDAFQNGNKRIIIFSKAGGTGKSYHADRSAKNQQQRVHYLLEAGWQADNAVQGFGRSHRSNQASAPIFKLVTTNLKGQMRFISTIAKRLDQLGAMTKGQRQAGSQGMFSASDNLENSFAADVLAGFYKDLVLNRVDGIDDGLEILEKLGLKNKILDEYNRIIPTATELREVNKFLNRILSLESSEQNTVFEGYSQRLQDATEKAMQAGTLDKGLENYKADKITLNEVQDIREDERSGAKTKYYNLTAEHKIKPVKFEDIPTESKSFVGFYKNKNTGGVRAVMQTSSSTDQYGNVTSNYKLIGQIRPEYIPQHRLYGNWVEIKEDEARELWNEELSNLPEYRKENLHLISGVVLPVWDKLPTENVRIYRVLTSDGEMLIGRVVSEQMIDETLRRLGSSRKREKIATKDLVTSIKNGDKVYLENEWMLTSRKVSGEDRIELLGPSYEHHDILMNKGVFAERIQYRTRYFVPSNTNTEKIMDEILKISPVIRVETEKYSIESEDFNNEQTRNLLSDGNSERSYSSSTKRKTKKLDGRSSRYREGRTTARERRKYCQTLKASGHTEQKIVYGHECEVIPTEHYTSRMTKIAKQNQKDGIDETIFVTGKLAIPFAKDQNGNPKRAKGAYIKVNGKKVIIVQYDNEFCLPEQINDHEKIHDRYHTPLVQKARNIIMNSLSVTEKKNVLEKLTRNYNGIIEGNEEKIIEEFVANVLSDMDYEYFSIFSELQRAYWKGDEQFIDNFKVSEYTESIDAGGINENVLNKIGFGASNLLLDDYTERALPEGSMLNEYHNDLDSYEWWKYYQHVNNYDWDIELRKSTFDFYTIIGNKLIKSNYSKGKPSVLKIYTVNSVELIPYEEGVIYDNDTKEILDELTKTKESIHKGTDDNFRMSIGEQGTDDGRIVTVDGEQLNSTSNYEVSERENGTISVSYSTSIDDDIAELTPERKKEIFEQFERDRVGIDKPTLKQIWGERAEWIAHNMTRVFPDIPERGERGTFFAEFRKMMIQWKALPQTSMFMAQDKLNQMTKDLTPDEFKTFSELVYFLDLQEEAQIQKERGYEEIVLPNGITSYEVNQIVDVLNKEATDNVKKALDKRRQIWDNLKEQYITLNQYIGFDTDGKFNRKNYYHHQVIEYMNQGGKGVAKGKDIEIKAGRGWLKERQGSTKAINTDFLAVEYKAMLQMQYDVYVANMLGKIKDQYDIKPQLEKQAFDNNKKLLNDIIIKESTGEDGNRIFDKKKKPDSETYRQQQWYNQRIMYGFSGLFELAEAGILPTFNGQYGNVIRALEAQRLNAPALYNYVGELASMELPETATDEELQAQISARTVLKYTSQKKAWVKEILGNDYQTWETLANDMSDTHSIHQPRRGNYFYTKTTIDEDAFNKAFNDMIVGLVAGENGVDTTADMKKVFEQYSETVRLMGAAYEQWVIPNEIETTMNKVANPKQVGAVSQASRTILSAWKGWSTSVNPLRTVKFGIRNIFGDLDAVIAGNPKVVSYSKQAVAEIYQAMKHKKYSPEFMSWVERGGYSSLIFANEMDTKMQDKLFSHLKGKEGLNIFKIPAKLFEGYYNGVESAHNFREAILRYSAYLYFKNDIIKNGGKVRDNVASNRYIIQGLQSVEDKAYQLSKDLLGAYDEVATMGQALRRHAIPFYSFTETNLKRYYRLFENIIMSDDNIPKKAGKLLLKGLMVNLLALLMVAWNKLVMKDEDDELPPSVRNIPHITLGKIGNDVYAFRQLGSFSELLEWVGFEDYKWTEEDLTAPLDKAVGMITPVVKTPVELLTGLNFYPSITQPRAIRDKVEYFFSTLGVDDAYKAIVGKPTKGIGDIAKGAVTYSYDYKESAYYEILDIKRKYQGDTDNTIYGQTPKSNALYYMKTAVRYKDKKAALKYLDEYFKNGGTAKGIAQSIEMLNPMYGYSGKDTIAKGEEFVKSLSDDEKDKLKVAISYYENDLMLPEDVSAMLRKKGITDEQAKNLLTNYINSKCK